MEIEDYRFGDIRIAGRSYTTDVIVTPEGVRDGWWRREGHRLHREDLDEVLAARPQALVIGTGYHGRMVVPPAVRQWLEAQGIQVHEAPTAEAVKRFNALQREYARVVAALHLTC
jgi:hypothetical protein